MFNIYIHLYNDDFNKGSWKEEKYLLESVEYNGKSPCVWKSENPGFKCLFAWI